MHQDHPATTQPRSTHDQHDPTLISGLAADDLTSTVDRMRAQSLVADCADCSALHADLVAIAGATRTLPPSRAPRDFRITAERAARLRRTGWLATFLAPFAGARSAARPLAAAFTTLGLAGVFMATVLPGLLGGVATSGSAPEAAPGAGGGQHAGITASAAPAMQPDPAASGNPDDQVGTKDSVDASADPARGAAGGDGAEDFGSNSEAVGTAGAPVNVVLVGSLALLGLGLVLFALRYAGRRLR